MTRGLKGKLIFASLALIAAGATAYKVKPEWFGVMPAPAVATQSTNGKLAGAPAPARAAHVSVERAIRAQVVETLAVTGTLAPRREVLVGPEIDGLRIIEILAEEGDRVIKDQVLVRLSRETLDALVAQSDAGLARADATIAQTRSQIAQAQASVTLAQAELGRAQSLLTKGASTQALVDQRLNASRGAQAQLEALRNALDAGQAEKKNLEAQRRELMIRVKRAEVRTPAAGLISRRSAKLGALASAAAPEPMFRIIEDGVIELDAELPEHRLLNVIVGQSAQVILADGATINGKVRLISPEVNQNTRLGKVRITLNEDQRARIGSFARGTIELRRSQSITIPASAVIYNDGRTIVQTVVGDRVRIANVKVGLITGGRAEILEGLSDGDRVVVRAGPFLREGDAVAPVSEQKVGLR